MRRRRPASASRAPGFRRQTSAAFGGAVTWTLEIENGYGWSYAAVGRTTRSVAFVALTGAD